MNRLDSAISLAFDAQAAFEAELEATYDEAYPFQVAAVNCRTRMLALRSALLDVDGPAIQALELL